MTHIYIYMCAYIYIYIFIYIQKKATGVEKIMVYSVHSIGLMCLLTCASLLCIYIYIYLISICDYIGGLNGFSVCSVFVLELDCLTVLSFFMLHTQLS